MLGSSNQRYESFDFICRHLTARSHQIGNLSAGRMYKLWMFSVSPEGILSRTTDPIYAKVMDTTSFTLYLIIFIIFISFICVIVAACGGHFIYNHLKSICYKYENTRPELPEHLDLKPLQTKSMTIGNNNSGSHSAGALNVYNDPENAEFQNNHNSLLDNEARTCSLGEDPCDNNRQIINPDEMEKLKLIREMEFQPAVYTNDKTYNRRPVFFPKEGQIDDDPWETTQGNVNDISDNGFEIHKAAILYD